MKGMDLSCASPASTAICVSIEKSSVILQGGRAIDRHNYHLKDERRSTRGLLNPSSSSSSSSSSHTHTPQSQPPTKSKAYPQNQNKKKKPSAKATDLINPPGSSRSLLSDTSFFDVYSEFDPISASVPAEPSRPLSLIPDDSPALKPSSSSTPSLPSPALEPSSSSIPTRHQVLQVVVLKVSLHCKACEGKVRKHISRMEGVTSFTIDFPTKKVTIIGDVTPAAVLASVSRIKSAQFWPSPSLPASFGARP
ncbi:hypothetical protein NE237_003495 [Protea cynaroides]|uniref:HMA domain-containing protein n=1 Tax=Protea cynaroides TaxID=273540 RepID=A0A9Q0KHG8_9MAGN|nr:hypothetical protein NE237_003495 [Protea cynaroides]